MLRIKIVIQCLVLFGIAREGIAKKSCLICFFERIKMLLLAAYIAFAIN